MKLSDGEKLILMMLCDLHKSLGVKSSIDPDPIAAAIRDGKDIDLKVSGAGRAQDKESLGREVAAILEMWSTIERGYKKLTVDEKREVEAGAGPLGRGVRFSGFCHDTETGYRETARVLIEETERFERFQGRNLDANMPCLEGYRRMLRSYEPMRAPEGGTRLTVWQIITLANAEKYAG